MVGFHIDSIINQECSHYSDISKESQTSNLQKSTKVKCKSDLIVYRSASIDSVSTPKNHKVYQCVKCQKIFNLKSIYQNHMQSHGKDCKNVYRCNICGKSFTVPARLTRHYRTHTGEKPYQCEYCNKSFSVKENLSVHRRIHTKERPYKCDVCESAFEHSGKLHRHMRIHTGERPHKCSICTKTFIQSGQLVIHMRTHTGEKPYICKSCGKGFTCSKQLKVHTRTHTGEKPYKCDICGKSFGYNHVLKLHQVAHYGEKFYKCTLCEETFNSKKLMELHIKTHSESSFNNLSASTESSLITTHNINKIAFCNNGNVNQIVPNNVNNEEKNSTLCAEVKDTPKNLNSSHTDNYESFTLRICELHNKSDDEKVPEFLTDKSHSSTTTSNMCLHKELNDLSLEKKLNEVIDDKLQISDPLSIVSESNLTDSCSYEAPNSDFFPKNYLPTLDSSNKSLHQNLEKDCGSIEEREQERNRELKNCERFSITYRNTVSAPLYTNHNFLEQSVSDNFSLPPRKRCRMILESMEIENTKLMATKRYNSVIRFASADNANLANV